MDKFSHSFSLFFFFFHFYLLQYNKPFKNVFGNFFFLEALSQDIETFVLTFCSSRKIGLIRKIRLISKFMTLQPG